MKVLVTGGAGYIGSHACKALALAGHEPVVYDNLSMGHRWAVKWGPLEVGDIHDSDKVVAVIRKHGIDAAMHFAASAFVGESMVDPMKYFMNNAVGTTLLLDSLLKCDVRKIVFSSTCATYGIPSRSPLDESLPTLPVNPYGESKLIIEKQLFWLGKLQQLRWIALRYFNAAGADPDGEIGEAHDPETHLIPLALQAALPGSFKLQVFGNDYPTPDGTAVRDYVHVADLAEAHVRSLELLQTTAVNDYFNLGTGTGVSVKEVISSVEAITGSPVRYEQAPRRAGDPPALVACADKAVKELGWHPRHSDIATIVADAWRWQQKAEGYKTLP